MNYWETGEWRAARATVQAAHQALLTGALDCPWLYGPEFFQYQADVMQPLRDRLAAAVEAKNRIADEHRQPYSAAFGTKR